MRDTIAERFVYPIARQATLVERGERLTSDTPMSAILFGPPGTSKTDLSKYVSEYLSWPRVTVDPSYLVKEGLDRIQAQANRLFDMLIVAEQVVVLLDEFDEMGRERSRTPELLSRFITTAMLPKLIEINKERKIVFLLATNNVSVFDAAFTRPGRFDMRVQVMVPRLPEKLSRWPVLRTALRQVGRINYRAVRDTLADLTYSECEALVKKLGHAPTSKQLTEAAKEAAVTATLRRPNHLDAAPANGDPPLQTTWKDTSEAERRQISLPPISS